VGLSEGVFVGGVEIGLIRSWEFRFHSRTFGGAVDRHGWEPPFVEGGV
jgi:hypothetical protein